ncbi:hypothetical protein GCM10010357_71420 [Streptomyces luteireticuli]|uniref:Helicase C-terminal domain-containing protein n=1 Tax=Streptomyces luteireticuli TaxID=173858 RepID=A0ABN0Z964_9ACTN
MGAVEDGRFGGIDLRPWGELDTATGTAYPLLFRMIDAGAMAVELWDQFLTSHQKGLISCGLGVGEEEARSLAGYLAAMQSIGKLTPSCQRGAASAWAWLDDGLVADAGRFAELSPERATVHTGLGLLEEAGFASESNDSAGVRAAQVLGAYRGRFLQLDVDRAASHARVEATLGGPAWRALRQRYARLLRYLFAVQSTPGQIPLVAGVLLAGLGTVADRLAGRRGFWLPNAHMPSFGAHEHHSRARAQVREAVEASGLARCELEEIPFTQAHPRLERPNALQASVMEELPGLVTARGTGIVVVTDATGAGKSVTALEAARVFNAHCGTRGLLWLLPTTATADAAYDMLDGYVRAHRPERAPVTLVHSHSWLNAAYTDQALAPEPGDGKENGGRAAGEEPGEPVAGPEAWLRGWEAALLAPYTVATVDQALMAVLPVRFNSLRLLALSGRTVVIDEAHALDPFSRRQLRRLLNWLGALGSPVVVLSATLPTSTCQELVRAYLSGAGRPSRVLDRQSFTTPYPGWLFADAATASCHRMSPRARQAHITAQRRTVHVWFRQVRHRRLGDAGRVVEDGERLSAIGELAGPVVREGGCAVVVCATVPDAQDTYQYLARTWPGSAGDLLLLHARFPGHVREKTMRGLRAMLGPGGRRPDRLVVVTTSLLDMSLDIDVDLMVSDLASISRLLQRAGRLARFAYLRAGRAVRRPPWWSGEDPRLTVLQPVNAQGATAVPPGWRTVESAFVLHATAALLPALQAAPLVVPDQVQDFVEHVHSTASASADAPAGHQRMLAGHQARVHQDEHLSAVHLIPAPARVSSLADLHRQHLTTAQAATRLGDLPTRLLPCYRTENDTLALDRAGLHPLPQNAHLSARQVRQVLQHTLPVPTAWVTRRGPAHRPPPSWHRHPLLADLVLLPSEANRPERFEDFGRHLLRMDDELGLIHDRLP